MLLQIILHLAVVAVLAGAQTVATSCQDLDTGGCKIFQHANPNLCSDPNFANITCKRFCGNCPIECYNCPQAVLDPADCNVTTVCGSGEVCNGLNFGFGKRQAATEDHVKMAKKREITVDCCDTDLCNLPLASGGTTTTSTGAPNISPTPIFTGTCVRDIVFLLDDSGSVGTVNFQRAVDFVKDVVSRLDVGSNTAQVSVMAFSTHPQIEWYLNTYHTKAQIQTALQTKVKYVSGTTLTGDALEATRTNILTMAKGDRPAVDNVVLVMTDGRSNNPAYTAAKAATLHAVAKDVIAIGVGHATSASELELIATDHQHVFTIAGYPNLQGIVPQILNLICS